MVNRLVLFALILLAFAVPSAFSQGAAGAGLVFSATLATPVDSPGAATYSSAQSVTITNPAPINCYTLDNSTPTGTATGCTHGTLYTGAFNISVTSTLRIGAWGPDWTPSAIDVAVYTIS